jgi:hypothetical protein
MWADGRTLRVKLLGGSPFVQGKVNQYALAWKDCANITLQFVTSGDAEIRVSFNPGGSWSYVGTDNLVISAGQPTMNYGWFTDSTPDDEFSRVIIHEFGHALGCIHEHQSPAANIPWNKPAVYAYYQQTQGWSPAQVDVNIFDLYAQSTTQYSAFDTQSIMLYAIPASLTTNGFSTGWNRVLSATDKSFIAGVYPPHGGDIGTFNTMDVRPWDQPRAENWQLISFPAPYSAAPGLPMGLNELDVGNGGNIRVNAYASDIHPESFHVHIDSWADTTLYSAGCVRLEVAPGDPDFQFGQFSTMDDHPWNEPKKQTSRQINFGRPYATPPQVVVWLNSLDMSRDANWRVNAYATDITATGFVIHIDTWADTVLYSGRISWIAYPSNKPNVSSGRYNTQDVRPWDQPRLANSGQATFGGSGFARPPRVLTALNSIDIDHAHNLRINLNVDSITTTGMTWHIDSWADTTLYSAGASYLAIG